MLTRMYCDNYKCLVNFELRPKALQLFIGSNGSGKSTVFEVLRLLRDFASRGEKCEDRFGGRTRTRWQDVAKQTFELEVSAKLGTYTYRLEIEDSGTLSQFKVVHESVTLDGSKLFLFEKGLVQLFRSKTEAKAQFPLHPYRSGLAMVESRPDDESLGWFKAWLDQLLYVQIDPRRMGSLAEREVAFPAFDLENFASWYRHLRLEDGTAMEALRRSLTEVISGFESLDLKEAGLNRRVLQVSTRVDGKAFQYSFEELSDGQRALVGLYTLLHRSTKQESLICIDEPDNFVALAEIQPWLMLLEDAQELGLQVLVASHHPELLNQLANKDGVVLSRPDFRHSQVRAFSALSDLPVTPAELIARGWEGV